MEIQKYRSEKLKVELKQVYRGWSITLSKGNNFIELPTKFDCEDGDSVLQVEYDELLMALIKAASEL